MKANCYECEYRGTVPGNGRQTHSMLSQKLKQILRDKMQESIKVKQLM